MEILEISIMLEPIFSPGNKNCQVHEYNSVHLSQWKLAVTLLMHKGPHFWQDFDEVHILHKYNNHTQIEPQPNFTGKWPIFDDWVITALSYFQSSTEELIIENILKA